MKQLKANLAVVIGRFQPIHRGHVHLIQTALDHADKVLILVGSANRAISPKNPWNYLQRVQMIQEALSTEDGSQTHVYFEPINDNLYNENRWRLQVQEKVQRFHRGFFGPGPLNNSDIILVGFKKDDTSYYLNNFPQWKFIDSTEFYLNPISDGQSVVDATTIRQMYFEGRLEWLASVLAPSTMNYLKQFRELSQFKSLQDEYEYYKKYKAQWNHLQHPVTFTTVDAVVVQSGHVLLVQRRSQPGKGQWALPGGFISPEETLYESCLRELFEETNLHLPDAIVERANKGYAGKDYQVFDAPDRSLRGRVITHAFYFPLDDQHELPRVRGGDDAAKAQWFSFAQVNSMSTKMFEDHADIVDYFINDPRR